MKKALICCCAGLLGICLAGCGTLREEQNPQPKKQAPCNEWLVMKQNQGNPETVKAQNTSADKKDKKDKKIKKIKKIKKGKKNTGK